MPTPSDQLNFKGDRLIDGFHFSKELSRTHGVPFKFVVKRGEKFLHTKDRLQARIGLPDSELSKYRFALPIGEFKQPLYLLDGMFSSSCQNLHEADQSISDDVVYTSQFTPSALGLDHAEEHSIIIRSWWHQEGLVHWFRCRWFDDDSQSNWMQM